MHNESVRIKPIKIWDLPAITRMVFANMTGVDQRFTTTVENRLIRYFAYFWLPIYFISSGRGYKAMLDKNIAGCGYLHLRRSSGYLFNISVNRPYRRLGVGTQLMSHLESITKAHGRRWAALEVDKGNLPAQKLYDALGYRPYHPHLFRATRISAVHEPDSTNTTIEPLSTYQGRYLFDRYAQQELRDGDAWASAVIADQEIEPRSGGTYWRCLIGRQEIGSAWTSFSGRDLTFSIVLPSAHWRDGTTVQLVRLMLAESSPVFDHLEVYLGSSKHHEATMAALEEIGLQTQTRPRLLMTKRLE